MKQSLLSLAVLGITLAAVATTTGSPRNAARRAINPPGTAEGLPFSQGVLVGNTLYVSGEEGLVNGKLAPGGIGPETEAALTNIKKIVEAGGMQMTDVVSVNVYLADIGDFKEMTGVYKTFFPEPRPARTTVQAGALVGGARVEISAIAVKLH